MRIAMALCIFALVGGGAFAQLPPDAVQLDKVKIPERQKSQELDPVTLETANPDLGTFEHDGVVYGMSKADTKDIFMSDPEKYAEQHAKKRWEYNFNHAMSAIWCPVTDEISPGGNLQWQKIGYTWESCCQFCNDTVTDEDFPRALERLSKRAAKAYELNDGAVYTEGASSPVAGAINLGGPTAVASAATSGASESKEDYVPEWVQEADLQPTYAGGIGLIMEKRCLECHRTGGLAPMTLETIGQVRKWSKNLKTHIENGTMPPWPADPSFDFANEKKLTDEEKEVFLAWIESGYAPGEGTYTPEKEWGEWAIGEPDKVIEFEEYTIPEDDADHIRTIEVDPGIDSEKWVTAAEVQADSFLVLQANGGPLGAYHTGNTFWELPEGYGFKLEPDKTYPLSVFYMKEKGWEEYDMMTKVGLKFADDPSSIEKEVLVDRMAAPDFTIPAGSDSTTVTAEFTFPADGEIVALNPVMRLRGKSVRAVAKLPDGTEKDLLSIPRWENAYHFRYELVEPLDVPKGTIVQVIGTFDNSDMNVSNPDPSKDVKSGLNGEKLEGWLYYTLEGSTRSAANRLGLTDEQLMASTGTCSKCSADACTMENAQVATD